MTSQPPAKVTGARLVAALVVLLSLGLIVHTWTLYDQTWDEGAHIAAGMEWLGPHTYTLDHVDPPLPRVLVALGPLLEGARFGGPGLWQSGNVTLSEGNYHALLYAARAGTMLSFLFAVYLLWTRTRGLAGEWAAAAACAFFCLSPPVIVHASLATTDMCALATIFWALDRLWRTLRVPSLRNALIAGVAVGLAALAKITALPTLSVCLVVLVVLEWYRRRASVQMERPASVKLYLRPSLAVLGTAFLLIWAAYFFSVGTIAPSSSPDRGKLQAVLSRHHLPQAPVFALIDHLPAPEYISGFREVRSANKNTHNVWVFGKLRARGVHTFFPVIFAVKMPIPFVALGLLGLGLAFARIRHHALPYLDVLVAGALVPMAVGMLGRVNQGLRHVLPILPFFAMLCAVSVVWLWRQGKLQRVVCAVLLGWLLTDCALAAPDPLPWFNALTFGHSGEWFTVDSDFDWGQDLKRLGPELRTLQAPSVAVAYNGTEDLARAGLPPYTVLEPGMRPTGWVAISEYTRLHSPAEYGWLNQYTPVARAGQTIRIYHIDFARRKID